MSKLYSFDGHEIDIKTLPAISESRQEIYRLYGDSVQDPPNQIREMVGIYIARNLRYFGKVPEPMTFKEDFCGTHALSNEWAKRSSKHFALGVDSDVEPVHYGMLQKTDESVGRVVLNLADVREYRTSEKFDIICGLNYSHKYMFAWSDLVEYFRRAYEQLEKGGVFIIDTLGGDETTYPCKEKTKNKGYTYIWELESYNAATDEVVYRIHFRKKGGEKIKNAFTYRWKNWTPSMLIDAMKQAGFTDVELYWERGNVDDLSEGEMEVEPYQGYCEQELTSWNAYIVGSKHIGMTRHEPNLDSDEFLTLWDKYNGKLENSK